MAASIRRYAAGIGLAALAVAVLPMPSHGFSDITSSTPFGQAIRSLREKGVVEGYADGTFKPRNHINRAEFLKIALEARKEEQAFSGADCFPDVQDEWFAKYVCTAREENIIEGYPDGTFKPEQPINFVEASKIIALTFGQEITEYSDDWYEPFVRALESSRAIPASIAALDVDITRGEMAEIMWRLAEERTDQNSKGYMNVKYPEVSVDTASNEPQQARSCVDIGAFVQEAGRSSPGGMLYRGDMIMMEADAAVPPMARAQNATAGLGSGDAKDYSATNVQVAGVDEGDIVKTDGTYLYFLSQENVRIVRAVPATDIEEKSVLDFTDDDFYPTDLYIDGDRLLVLGSRWQKRFPIGIQRIGILPPPWYQSQRTEVRIYNVTDRSTPKMERRVSFEGSAISSRVIDDKLYLVVQQAPDWPIFDADVPFLQENEETLLPRFEDSMESDEEQPVARCGDVMILPHTRTPTYLTIATIPTRSTTTAVQREVVLGNGDTVYASLDHLYVAATRWQYRWNAENPESHEQTDIYRFAFTDSGAAFRKKGTVPGRILNQFSMDEHDSTFRIATTTGQIWRSDTPSSNNLYILNMDMERIGAIEDIAPGEQIYSTRFVGDRTYMVTFRNVDPFFVIDTSDPTNPRILGQLKIPGYSDYLHPYDEHHIIGFGKEAVADKDRDDFAWYQGMKIAVFDVTDVGNPTELHKTVIGDRGTTSPLLSNHRALLFEKDRNLLSFPVTVYEIPEHQKKTNAPSAYGSPVFQGAHVYELTLENGFRLRGTLSHYDAETYLKAGDYWRNTGRDIERIVRIGNSLYTLSAHELQSHAFETLQQQDTVTFTRNTGDFEDVVY